MLWQMDVESELGSVSLFMEVENMFSLKMLVL